MTNSPQPVRMAFLPTGRRKFLEFSLDWSRTLNVDPVVWFGDGHLDAEVKKLFPACEIIPQSLAVNPSSSDFSFGPPSLSAEDLEKFFETTHYKSYSYLVGAEYDRFPRMATLRAIDREAIVRRLAQYLLGVFSSRRPDFLLAMETPHNALGLMTLAVCAHLRIPTLFFQPTSSIGPNMVPRTSLNEVFSTKVLQSRIGNLNRAHPELSKYREEILVRLLNGYGGNQPPPRFVQQQNRSRPNRPQLGTFRPDSAMERLRDVAVTPRFRALVQVLLGRNLSSMSMELLFDRFRDEFLDNASRLPASIVFEKNQKLALFGLHYQPERTSIPEGPLDSSLVESVLRARRSLPPEVHLIVKEHPSQVAHGRTGFLGRSHHFYEFLENIPGVTLAGPKLSLFELFGQISLTFTLTGTLGIQSVLRSIPVVYFGNPWWQGLPGSYRFESVLQISEVLSHNLPSKSEVTDFVKNRVLEQSIPGFSSPSQEKSWLTTDPVCSGAVSRKEEEYLREVLVEFLKGIEE